MSQRAILPFAILLFTASCGSSSDIPTAPSPSLITVAYRVTGTGAFSMTFQNSSSETLLEYHRLPWAYSFQATPGAPLFIKAQGNGDDDRPLHVEILKNGVVCNSADGIAAFGVTVTCTA